MATEVRAVEIMEEVPREEVLQQLQRQHLPVVLLPVEAPAREALVDRADMDRKVTDKEAAMGGMYKDMEEVEVTVVAMEVV